MSLRHPLVETFQKIVAEKKISAVTFDVFDTLVTRTYAQPTDLFVDLAHALQRQKLIAASPARFARMRVGAEKAARLARDDNEPNLAEIYAALALKFAWSAEQSADAQRAELEFEKRSIRVNPFTAPLVRAAREQGLPIAFVSDMYLPSGFIRELLVSHGIATDTDPVFVSCEHRVSKARGELFDRVQVALNRRAAEILHIGDNEQADAAKPHQRGFAVWRLTNAHLGAIEQLHVPFSAELDGLPGKIAAASRNARLRSVADVENAALFEIGSSFLGPLLTSFALWTFQGAKAAGAKRLYYVARDGQVMREIALAVQRRLTEFQDIDCRYIYGSRIAWHHASLAELDERHLRWLLDAQPVINAQIFAKRIGVEASVVEKALREAGAPALATSASWSENDIGAAKKILVEHQSWLLEAAGAERRRKLGRAYFEQEGLLDGTPWALVELGWSGSMLTSLCHALGRRETLPAFYLCQSHEDVDLPALVALRSFLMQPHGSQFHFGRGLRLSEIIEALSAADHPTTLGYREENGRVAPIFKTGTTPMWPAGHLKSLRAGATAFVEALDDDTLNKLRAWTREETSSRLLAIELLAVLCRFVEEPSRELAMPFTECVFSEDPAEQHRRTFVQKVGLWKALKERVFTSEDLWPQGSLACSNGLIKALVTGGFGYAFEHMFRQVRRRFSPF